MSTTRILLATGALAATTVGLGYWRKHQLEAANPEEQKTEQQKPYKDFLESAQSFVNKKVDKIFGHNTTSEQSATEQREIDSLAKRKT